MEVILLERVAKLGQMGEVVRVRDGVGDVTGRVILGITISHFASGPDVRGLVGF